MARKKKTEPSRPIESYEHRDKQRLNNPLVGLVTPETDPDSGQKKKTYAYDPHLDPQLVWACKVQMSRVVQHVFHAVRQENTERLEPIFDGDHPIRSTGEIRPGITGKPCERTKKSHINVCVYDSAWEASDAFILDENDAVAAWVKNDYLGFEVFYVYRGVVRKYRPDFLVHLKNGDMLVLETKGQDTDQDRVKRRYLDQWTEAVNSHGGFGRWR